MPRSRWLVRWACGDQNRTSLKPNAECEYGCCGGLGRRLVAKRRVVRVLVTVDGKTWRVCESCADLLIREARKEDAEITKEYLPPG